jgi:hypothetical protein
VTKAPSDAAVNFLLAETVRQEVGGKLTIIGFYPGNQLLIPKGTKQTVTPLAFIFLVLEGEGTFPSSISLVSPSGKAMFQDEKMPDTVKIPKQPLSVLVGVQPFVTDEIGKFDVTLRLGDASYRRSFTVDFAP